MLTYRTYLRLPELFGLQTPAGPGPGSDETVFIVAHQVCELWFMLLIDALEKTRDGLLAGELECSRRRLARVNSLQRLLLAQTELVETISPADFAAFRQHLGSASGMQSAQYHEIEYLSGAKNPAHLQDDWLAADERARLAQRLSEPSLWDGFLEALRSRGLPVGSAEQVAASLAATAAGERSCGELWAIAEDLRTYDTMASVWRLRHAQLAARYIVGANGTGGSRGPAYPHKQVDHRYFPLLWQLTPGNGHGSPA